MSVDQVNDAIQRWRNTPGGGLKQEDHQLFNKIGFAYLAQGDSARLLKHIQDEKNKVFVSSMGCGLLAPIANGIIRKEKGHDHCQTAMTHLTKICSPNELLSSLLEVLENTDPDVIADTVIALAPHLQTALLRMDEDKAASLGLALSALRKQVSRLPVPYTQQQEATDDYGLCRCCSALTTFVKPFVEEVKESNSGGTTAELKTELLTFCMGMLREPLLQAQLDQARKSPLRCFATEILVTLSAIQEPHSNLLFYTPLKRGILLDQTQFKESKACLAYLLFVQLITKDSFPVVFSPVFVLQCNMEYIHVLLSRKSESFLLKGLALCEKSLENVQDDSLPVDLLELTSFHSVPQILREILTDCPMQHLRERGLQVFQLFINKLDAEAKHKFFRCMLKTSHHAGVEGYITKNIKNQVEFSMKPGNGNGWFLGVAFLPLLELALCLPQGTNTDLLHGMDRIMECLNLLRYLLIRDKEWKSNTSMWTELCRIKDEYLKTLRVCLSISRAYYISEVKALREDQKLKGKEARAAVRSTKLVKGITVRNERVSEMSPECQYQVLQSALVTFDLMESLIVRVEEITEEKIKTNNRQGANY
ncbi:glomulin-like [Lampris incognitus]|uniref:glomulin-like n=1 Tax=Lampris incognitus TaxID=2546036 RepID=UPI0024B487F0|nr:glomulin-like [Lampris incognitus]